jgi:4'-phosphopantetheinyl transferase
LLQRAPQIRHWRPVRHPPALSPGELHLWKIDAGAMGAPLARLWPLLSEGESERAGRFRFDRHRERYVRAHAALRGILSGYVGIEPRAIGLRYSAAGRPYLDGIRPDLDFNLTTSGDLALVGLSLGQPVGVDCEQVCERRDVVGIAERMFTPEAASSIAAAAGEERLEQFHIAWTALEAEVKVDGRGLAARTQPGDLVNLQVRHCVPAPGFITAVARRDLPPVADWIALELSSD